MEYVNEEGKKERPVVIHRAILGSLDRFVAFLLEETKGVLPIWLAPTQVYIIPVNPEYHLKYSEEIKSRLEEAGFRVELDDRNEKLSYRMRESQVRKVPVTLILGDGEVADATVSYRQIGSRETTTVSFEELVELLRK